LNLDVKRRKRATESFLGILPILDEMKTNNSLEGYHLKLQMYYRVEHPSFWVFLEGLKNFDASVDADINELVNSKEINKRKKMWEAVQARKKTIV
jgi:hemerythrin superfamily protein